MIVFELSAAILRCCKKWSTKNQVWLIADAYAIELL